MKKNLLLAASILTIGGFLAACGTEDTAEENSGTTPEETTENVVEEETAEEVPAEDTVQGTEDQVAEETEAVPEEDTTAEEPADTEGETSTEEAQEPTETDGTLTQSPEQAYELTVLPAYELTAEEPGKDSLYLSSDSSVFMRIETFSPEDIDFAYAEDIMKQTLQAVNSEAEVAEGTALEGEEFINSSVYEIPSEEGKVTGIVFEKEGIIVRLTIFDKTAIDATPDFIKMGQTIEATE